MKTEEMVPTEGLYIHPSRRSGPRWGGNSPSYPWPAMHMLVQDQGWATDRQGSSTMGSGSRNQWPSNYPRAAR